VATKIAKVLFAVVGLLLLIAGLLPALGGQEVNTTSLSTAVVFLILAVALRPRRPPVPPSGPGA
jgi:hypothetical protein